MIKRPKCGESEDDLLKFQEEFFRSKQQPSVVVKKAKQADTSEKDPELSTNPDRDVVTIEDDTEEDPTPRTPLQFPNDQMNRFTISDSDLDPRHRLDVKDKEHVEEILTNIQEKDIKQFAFNTSCYKAGFPKVPKLNKDLIQDVKKPNTGKKKSLFAQQYSSFNEKKDFGKEVKNDCVLLATNKLGEGVGNDPGIASSPVVSLSRDKDIVSGYDLRMESSCGSKVKSSGRKPLCDRNMSQESSSIHDEVHQENVERLKKMSEEEILEEQQKLLSTLDPKLVDFIRTRKKVKVQGDTAEENHVMISHHAEMNSAGGGRNIIKESSKYEEGMNQRESEAETEAGKRESEKQDLNSELGIKKNFVNMDVVEKEKLEWMKDVPRVEIKDGSNIVPRFDFEGLLIDPDDDIPASSGLFHHGDEAGTPGYTLEELFHLARSNFPQQRVFALQLLAKILDMYHRQKFVGRLSADLLTKCLDAGLIFILRWSLDEQNEQIYSAAASAFANVIYVMSDQDLIENLLFTDNRLPSLCTYYKKKDEDSKDGKTDQTDAQLLSADLIKGLLQIQILPRLRYIIEMCNPSETAINNCLCVLIRMVQHNAEVAHSVFKHELLMPSVFRLLSETGSGYMLETKVLALQFVRCLCQASKSISHDLMKTFKLHELISSEFSSKRSSSLYSTGKLYIQICHIWASLLKYGMCTDLVRDLYSVIMNELQQFSSSYKNLGDKMMASLINVVDTSIECSKNGSVAWSLIEGLFPVVYHVLRVLQKDMFEERKVSHPYFISALMRLCGTYYQTKNTQLTDVNPVTLLDEVEKYWNDIIEPIISSPLLHKLLDELPLYSDFKSFKHMPESSPKNPENLPSYGTYCLCGIPPPSLDRNSPMMIVQDLLKLIVQLITINKVLVAKALAVVVAPETMAYIKFLLECGNLRRFSTLASTRVEMSLLSHLLQLFYLVGTSHGFLKFGQAPLNAILEMTFHLISYMHHDDLLFVQRLMRNVVFNPKVFRRQDYVLWLSEYWDKDVDTIVKVQVQNARKDIQVLGSMYTGILLPPDLGQVKVEPSSLLMATLQTKAVPSDWMFFPIVHFFNASVNIEESGGVIAKASCSAITTLKQCLEYVLLVEVTRPALVANIPETIRFTRLLCLFMTEGLMFTEKPIKELVMSLLAVYSSPTFQTYLNFEMPVPGITSFYDFYKNVVQMYISTSFSDAGFANILLFPLQLQHLVKYRLLIWTESSEILRIFPLPLSEVMCDVKKFLAAENEDMVMIRLYFQALVGGTVNSLWCPLFYLIAVHHVNHFIFSLDVDMPDGGNDDKELISKERVTMLNTILSMDNKEVRQDIVLYKCFDINRSRGIGKFVQLPPSRDMFIRRIKGSS